jgi:RNA polymerase sigma factor (sigma-70 family)
MPGARTADLLRQLEDSSSNDHELLARFVRERDHSAFKELVVRYGPVVLGVCRRVTGHLHDAEDSFQAVFLILARKAPTIRKPEVLGSWLHRVALRVAQTARRTGARRCARETVVSAMPDRHASPDSTVSELSPILDQELAALPSWYRDAIVLCDLQGLTREQAAETLGVPEGTLSSRLANGRRKLADRLTKRGITLSVASMPITLNQAASAPIELLEKTCALVADWMAGSTIPRTLVTLTRGGMTMRKMLFLGMLTAALAASGVVYAFQSIPNQLPTDPRTPPAIVAKPEAEAQPTPKAKEGNKPVVFTNSPKLRNTYDMALHGKLTALWDPKGNYLAVGGISGGDREKDQPQGRVAVLSFDPVKDCSLLNPSLESKLVGITADAKEIIAELYEDELLSGSHRLDFWKDRGKTNLNAQRYVDLDLVKIEGYAFADDGKTFRAVWMEQDGATGEVTLLHVKEADAITGMPIKSLLKVGVNPSSFSQSRTPELLLSPDGKKLAVTEKRDKIVVYDVDRATKLSSYYLESQNNKEPICMCFSANGHLLAIGQGIGVNIVLDTDTGTTLSPLEGGNNLKQRIDGGPPAFSGDGRLLAILGERYKKIDPSKAENPRMAFDKATLTVWDTQSGKALKTWAVKSSLVYAAFNPVRPLLAVLEPKGNSWIRAGFWDFSVEAAGEK